ncbi:MAG: L,D-transpeptidase family protein [Gemmobacter sp.]
MICDDSHRFEVRKAAGGPWQECTLEMLRTGALLRQGAAPGDCTPWLTRGGLPRWAVPIGPGDLWSDDPADPDYNLMVRAPHPFGHERLRRADGQYDALLVTGWNWPRAVAGRGSAIFVHVRRGPQHPTAGCVGLARADLLWIARRLRPWSRLVVRGARPQP